MSCSELIGEIAEGEMLTPQEACQYNLGSIDPQWNDVLVHNLCCATCNLSPHPGGPTVPPSEQKCKQINDQCLDLLTNVSPKCSAGATPAFPYQCKSRLGKCCAIHSPALLCRVYICIWSIQNKQTNKPPFSKPVLARVRGRVDTSMRMRVCGYLSALPLDHWHWCVY